MNFCSWPLFWPPSATLVTDFCGVSGLNVPAITRQRHILLQAMKKWGAHHLLCAGEDLQNKNGSAFMKCRYVKSLLSCRNNDNDVTVMCSQLGIYLYERVANSFERPLRKATEQHGLVWECHSVMCPKMKTQQGEMKRHRERHSEESDVQPREKSQSGAFRWGDECVYIHFTQQPRPSSRSRRWCVSVWGESLSDCKVHLPAFVCVWAHRRALTFTAVAEVCELLSQPAASYQPTGG